jgi:hypothetical protein
MLRMKRCARRWALAPVIDATNETLCTPVGASPGYRCRTRRGGRIRDRVKTGASAHRLVGGGGKPGLAPTGW